MGDAFLMAVGMLLILEGIGPLLVPNRWINYLRMMADEGPGTLQKIGAGCCIAGAITLFLAQP